MEHFDTLCNHILIFQKGYCPSEASSICLTNQPGDCLVLQAAIATLPGSAPWYHAVPLLTSHLGMRLNRLGLANKEVIGSDDKAILMALKGTDNYDGGSFSPVSLVLGASM